MTKYEESLFTVRYTGDNLDQRGVGIYDLGTTLVAFQRVIHKAYLIEQERFKPGAFPVREDREWLAFQLGERKRASDAYALIPIITDPYVINTVRYLADTAFNAIVGYYTGTILAKNKHQSEKQALVNGAIYAEVVNIVGRIDAAGGVGGIEIGAPGLNRKEIAVFDSSRKDFVNSLKSEYTLGQTQTIVGRVYKLYPDSKIVQIKRAKKGKCTVFLDDLNFDRIRYSEEDLTVSFTGRPRYPFGVDSQAITEFEAYKVQVGGVEG